MTPGRHAGGRTAGPADDGSSAPPGTPRRITAFAVGGLAVLVAIGLSVVALLIASTADVVGGTSASHPGGHPTTVRSTGTALDPGMFTPGSCLSFPPLVGNRHQTVFLDAGHGGIDPGAVGVTLGGKTIFESTETLAVELDTAALLRSRGYRVVVSRTTDTTVLRLAAVDQSGQLLTEQGVHDEVAARDVCADDAKADILVGIYFDSGGSAQDAGSITAYDAVRPFSQANLRLATFVQNDVLWSMNSNGWAIPDDGVAPDPGLGSLSGGASPGGINAEAASYDHLMLIGPSMAGFFSTPSTMPGAIVEPLYLTDPFEGTVADSVVGQQAIARGIALAAEQYLAEPSTR